MPENQDKLSFFLADLTDRIRQNAAHSHDTDLEDCFAETMIEYMIDASEMSDGRVCRFRSRGMKVNGYGLSDDQDQLDLVVCDYDSGAKIKTISNGEVEDLSKRARNFFLKAREESLKDFDGSLEAADLATLIAELKDSLSRVRIFVFTDRVARVAEMPNDFNGDIEFSYHLWDLERLHRFESSGGIREKIELNFMDLFGETWKCLPAPESCADYRCYLAVIPAQHLVQLYSLYGPRLLERNVRSFLQVKGNVNKGIRRTLADQPEMFLAFNNGLTATAQTVKLRDDQNGKPEIEGIVDLQIVNGGQTTGSIYDFFWKSTTKADNVYIPLKLTEITDPARLEEIAPNVARYANSQNKVNIADFSANDPFHVQLEALSRTVWAPARQGAQRQTKWFYERARGQYFDERARAGTPGKIRAFEKDYPRPQVFTKTDLAKFEHSWDQLPYWVSRGSQKNFSQFTVRLMDRGKIVVDEEYFKRLVAKAILFRQTERIVSAENFGGYRANIVTYTVSWLSHRTAQRVNLENIWRLQNITPLLADALRETARAAHIHITHPPDGANVTEWCKKERCWDLFRGMAIELSPELMAELTGGSAAGDRIVDRGMENLTDEERLLVNEIISTGAETWFQISRWAKETNNLAAWQRGLAYSLGQVIGKGRRPTRKQAIRGKEILREAERLGFSPKTI